MVATPISYIYNLPGPPQYSIPDAPRALQRRWRDTYMYVYLCGPRRSIPDAPHASTTTFDELRAVVEKTEKLENLCKFGNRHARKRKVEEVSCANDSHARHRTVAANDSHASHGYGPCVASCVRGSKRTPTTPLCFRVSRVTHAEPRSDSRTHRRSKIARKTCVL
jgi:hypothetical protein